MSRTTSAQKESIAEFAAITGASVKDATSFLKKHNWRLDAAIDGFYANPSPVSSKSTSASDRAAMEKRIGQLFDQYAEEETGEIGLDGTINFCQDLEVDPEDVVLLAIAYELKSPAVGEWKRPGWIEGWMKLQCDSLPKIKAALPQLSKRLANDTDYLQSVYNYTFDFAKSESGQRSIPVESATAFWLLLLPAGLPPRGTALRHMNMNTDDSTGDLSWSPSSAPGWKVEYNQLWFDYLKEKGSKGINRDTWTLFFDFIRVADEKFKEHDLDGAWPSTIDEFVEWVQDKV